MDNQHIEIAREDIRDIEYAFRSNPSIPKPPQRNRGGHGSALKNALANTVSNIINNRREIGVDTEALIVIELSSGEAMPSVEILQSKFNLEIVEETKSGDCTKFVVQFASKNDILIFENERALWESDSTQNSDVLTVAQRRDLFACIESIRAVSPEDRTGKRLADAIENDALPDGLFTVDIDVWFDGDISKRINIEKQIKSALGTSGSTLLGDLFVLPNLLLGRARVNRFTLEALRKLDLVAQIDLPIGTLSTEQCELYSADFIPTVDDTLDENAPVACVIDSGVFTGNPLLSNLIVAEEDFDLTENTTADLNGHGTGTAGIVAYGSFENFDKENQVFKPLVRIYNAKVMHNESIWNTPVFPEDKRPEEIVDKAIRFFHDTYGCRVFNLSVGFLERVYNGGRQMAWASLLDKLSRELDIVIVISAGNVTSPNEPLFTDRNTLMESTRNQLISDKHRLIDPATSALGITVGSITRYSEPESFPNRVTPLSVGKSGYPSAFTRTGEGVSGAIKPEFVDYGGNYALSQLAGKTSWTPNRALNEPTLNNTIDKVLKGWQGTSFAAPHVTHIAARLQRALYDQLDIEPSANLIRALLASSARYVERDWLDSVVPVDCDGKTRRTQEWRLRLSGYGKVDDTTLFTDRNHVTLFTEDILDLRQIHLYKIPIPTEFLKLDATKRIAIGFAYNPPTRLSRKDYIANSLWFEVFRRIDVEKLLDWKGKKEKAEDDAAEQAMKNFASIHGAKDFLPGYTEVMKSTLQQRVWEKGARGGGDLLWDDNEPFIFVLVTGKARFKHPDEQVAQPYAMAITFSYESEADIQLRQKLSEQVRIKQREQIRTRAQVQV